MNVDLADRTGVSAVAADENHDGLSCRARSLADKLCGATTFGSV
jgi:hypothetical protein